MNWLSNYQSGQSDCSQNFFLWGTVRLFSSCRFAYQHDNAVDSERIEIQENWVLKYFVGFMLKELREKWKGIWKDSFMFFW